MSSFQDDGAVGSPCTSVCAIDRRTGLCAGCYRTLDEIAGWIDFSPEQKRALLRTLSARRESFGDAIAARHTAGNEGHGSR
ncbi:MAG: DUF1289 domain-containing protein [Casimicrobiaceae bacterium]